MTNFMQKCRFYVRLCYIKARPIEFHYHTFTMTITKINWIRSTQKRMTIAMKINLNVGIC